MPSYPATRAFLWGALAAAISACSPPRGGGVPAPVTPDTTRVVERPVEPAPLVFPRPRWEQVTYQLTTQGVTEDKGASIRDSLQANQQVLFQPVGNGRGSTLLRVIQLADSISLSAVPDTGRIYQVAADGTFTGSALPLSCAKAASTVSPIVVRFLTARYAASWPQTDSLVYETCVQGVRSQVRGSITWQRPVLDPARASWSQVMLVTGHLLADSSRTLPLHLQGTLEGSATTIYPTAVAQASQVQGKLKLILNARSSIKQQRIEQNLTFQAVRR